MDPASLVAAGKWFVVLIYATINGEVMNYVTALQPHESFKECNEAVPSTVASNPGLNPAHVVLGVCGQFKR